MNYKWILFVAIFIFGSCNDGNDLTENCNTDNPLQMKWMAEWVGELQNCTCAISIFQADFNGETVFWPLITDPLCQAVIENVPVYNCTGEEILMLNNNTNWQNFSSKITERKIIYVCSRP